MTTRSQRTDRIDLRVTPEAKKALQTAAESRHKTVTEFVLDSALRAADAELADRRLFNLSTDQWKAFQAALDAPPRSTPRLEKLLREQGVFD